jgi:hypothetical protein
MLGLFPGDGVVDGSHPNDLGFQWTEESLALRLRRLLELH